MNVAGETSKIAPAGEASAKPQKLTGSPVAGAIYVPEDDEVYFLTPSQWKAANREAEESDKCIRDFIEKVENALVLVRISGCGMSGFSGCLGNG